MCTMEERQRQVQASCGDDWDPDGYTQLSDKSQESWYLALQLMTDIKYCTVTLQNLGKKSDYLAH